MHKIACLLGDWVWACQFKLAMLVSEDVMLFSYKLDAYNKYSPLTEKWGGANLKKNWKRTFRHWKELFLPLLKIIVEVNRK